MRTGRYGNFRRLLEETVFSLERRLAGALIIIAMGVGAMFIVSQNQVIELGAASARLQTDASNAQRALRLEELVDEFRAAANRQLAQAATGDWEPNTVLTDVAIEIGDEVNALRFAGVPLYELQDGMMSFDDLDKHVGEISDAAASGEIAAGQFEQIENRNLEMIDLAALIAATAEEQQDHAMAALEHSTSKWNRFVSIVGAVIGALVLLLLYDLTRNILPAMRRMHANLRRLADGELDIQVEQFTLHELKELAGPLETFRRNALAVKNLAFTDPLTGLPNRRAIIEQATERLDAFAAGDGARPVLMVADIDRFKHVNDDFGHAAGDRLVQLVAERMKEHLGGDAVIARIGGDEFAICHSSDGKHTAHELGMELARAMRAPFDLGEYNVAITISLGALEVTPEDAGEDVNFLLDRADLALYAAKNEGRNRAVLFAPQLEADRKIDRMLERDLAKAVLEGQLRVVYQPIHSIDGEEDEVEALVRWQHPELGEIPPARFIPAAERSGCMVQLGAWIIERALSDLRQWPDLAISINLSPLQLQQDGFVPFLLESCRKNRIASQRVILEVTESLSIERNSRALLALGLLRNAGFRIALDDFGTGYSSLSMMKTFRFDRLKLDRSLVCDLERDTTAQAVFDAAVTMALRVGAQVVAEGISDSTLIEPVSNAGCTHLQGFHFSHPLEAADVPSYYLGEQSGGTPMQGRSTGEIAGAA